MKYIKALLIALVISAPISIATAPEAYAVDMGSWRKKLVKQIRKYQKYPPSAVNRQIEGRGKARVVFNPDGSVANFEIVESTGAKVLDREIPKIIKKFKMPALPDGKEYAIQIPFVWRLQ